MNQAKAERVLFLKRQIATIGFLWLVLAGCSASLDEPLRSPDGNYEANFVTVDDDRARIRKITITSADGDLLYDSAEELTVRDRDYVFGVWNSNQELLVYTSDTGTYEISTNDGTTFDLETFKQGECITVGPEVNLSDDDRARIERC